MTPKKSKSFFIRSAAFILFLGNLGAFFDGIFRIYLFRNISPEQAGLYSALYSSISILLIVPASVEVLVTKKITENNYKIDFATQNSLWIKRAFFVISFFTVFVTTLCLLFQKNILKYYRFDDVFILYFLLFFYIFLSFGFFFSSFLKGTRNFISYYLAAIFFEGAKVITLFFFIFFGFSLLKAYYSLSISVGIYISVLCFFFYQKKKEFQLSFEKKSYFLKSCQKYFAEYFYTLIFFFFMVIIFNIQVVLVRFIFPAQDSGKYAVIVAIRNMIPTVLSPLLHLIFPFFVDLEKNKEKFKLKWLWFLFGVNIVIAFGGSIAFYFFKEKIFANKYNDISLYVFLSGINGIFLSMIQYLCFYYLMKIKSFQKYFILLSLLGINSLFLLIFAKSLISIIFINMFFFVMIFCLAVFFISRYLKFAN